METTLYPEYKNAGEIIASNSQKFYSDNDLEKMLIAEKGTAGFQFKILNLRQYLLEEHAIDLIRSEHPDEGKGQKVATPSESLNITVKRLQRRVNNAAHRQRKVLSVIDRTKLIENEPDLYDRNLLRNGLMLSFLGKMGKTRILPETTVRLDVPKLL